MEKSIDKKIDEILKYLNCSTVEEALQKLIQMETPNKAVQQTSLSNY